MKKTRKSLFQRAKSKSGMTLVEVLVALTLLTLIIFVFTPLFINYYQNIKLAGDMTKTTYQRSSIMERLVANKGAKNDTGYETSVSGVPITLINGYTPSNRVTFPLGGKTIDGRIIQENGSTSNSYSTFYTLPISNGMVCFPASITDDFLTKEITLVSKGFEFDEDAEDKNSTSNYNFKVYYTDSSGNLQLVDTKYYDIRYETDEDGTTVAVFTLKGGTNVICFEHSPLRIQYQDGENSIYPVNIEIGAPEIILVGERPIGSSDYYYYATAGVDLTTGKTGQMDIIAKKMTGDAKLTAAINDVEWVEKGRGDDGNGGVNQYGYYVMGGDEGIVRRFWRNETTGNYYWGGDTLTNYNRYGYINTAGTGESGSYENMTETKNCYRASFKNIFRSPQENIDFNGVEKANNLADSEKISLFAYSLITSNYFTANVSSADYGKFYVTMGSVLKTKNWLNKLYQYYGSDVDSSESEFQQLWAWQTGGGNYMSKMNVNGYMDATNYEYKNSSDFTDKNLITITSVGAIQINTSNSNYSQAPQASTPWNSNVYPTKSYTLYCGYIPAVIDIWGWKTQGVIGYKRFGHAGTLGIAYSKNNSSWYPVGKFADIYTTSTSLNTSIFGTNPSWKDMLNFFDDDKFSSNANGSRDSLFPNPGKSKTTVWSISNGNTMGLAMPGEGDDYYITNGNEVDVTIGYLSQPYAISVNKPVAPIIKGLTGSDYFFKIYGSNSGSKYDHTFFNAGLRDYITMLDVKSFHDDITGNNISLAVGYTLSFLANDYSWMTRLGHTMNTGIVYIRATGDGNNNDAQNSMESGKGWSLAKETNVFHQFYGIDQYSSGGTVAARGWDTSKHRLYFNLSSKDNRAPQNGYSPNRSLRNSNYGTNCHTLAQTECTTVNWGTTYDEKPQAMWGTANGTLLSWFYDYENKDNSKITSVTKEFENYTWSENIGQSPKQNYYYDYNSVAAGNQSTYGFISVLSRINDVAFSDGTWVAVGNQSTVGGNQARNPANYCASSYCYSHSSEGSFVNVKFKNEHGVTQWKAVRISTDTNININSVVNCQGVWYIMGYVDRNKDGINDDGEPCVMFFSTHPEQEWTRCRTRRADGSYIAAYSNNLSNTASYAVYYDNNGTIQEMELNGINKMACQ